MAASTVPVLALQWQWLRTTERITVNHHQVNELQPCPFCGGSALIEEHEAHSHAGGLAAFMPDYPGSFTLECMGKDCNTGLIADTRAEVVAMWNRRAAPTSEPGLCEGCHQPMSKHDALARCPARTSEPAADRDAVLREALEICQKIGIKMLNPYGAGGAFACVDAIREQLAAPAAPAVPAAPLVASEQQPVMWFEAEASAKKQSLRYVLSHSMMYSTRTHTTKPDVSNNALWPLYEHPAPPSPSVDQAKRLVGGEVAALKKSDSRICPTCDGKGSFYGEECSTCQGAGRVPDRASTGSATSTDTKESA